MNTNYIVECWGAEGNGSFGGKGAYTKGLISFPSSKLIYIYVGEQAKWRLANFNEPQPGTFNGGGAMLIPFKDANNATGAGATDIRLTNGNWDNFNSLKSRIMVAAGAGSCINDEKGNQRSHAGGLSSPSYEDTYGPGNPNSAVGATQTSGYKFGIGQDGERAGAGGGYYGGCAGTNFSTGTGIRGAGGSSFISGHTGCNAIKENSTSSNIVHTGQPNHYSGYVFTNTVMKAGNEVIPIPTGGTETGHSGNGYARITWMPVL